MTTQFAMHPDVPGGCFRQEREEWAHHRARIHLDQSMRKYLEKFSGSPTTNVPSFDAVATCALYNSGDRESWLLYPEDGYLVQQDGGGLVRVTVNPDGTVEPKQL